MMDPSLNAPERDTDLAMRLAREFIGLSAEARIRVLTTLLGLVAAQPAVARPASVNSIQELGVWEDSRTAEEIIADIYASRTSSERPMLDEL